MTIDFRAPTSDDSVVGTWSGSASTRYTLVDDYPDSSGSDSLTCTALSGGLGRITFGFPAFTIPDGSTINQVVIRYYDSKASGATASAGSSVKVGGTYYYTSNTAHNPATSWTIRSDVWSTNPATALAWTAAQINGTAAANNLQAFGVYSIDTTPNVSWSSVQIDVDYTPPPVTGTITSTLGALVPNVQGKVNNVGTISATFLGVSSSFTGEVSTVAQGGYFSLFWLDAGGAGSFENSSTFSSTLLNDTASFAGTVTNNGTFTPTLAGVSSSFSGDVAADNATFYSLFWLEGGGAGLVTIPTGTFASTLDDITGSFTGTLLATGTVASTLDGITSNFSGFVGNTYAGYRSFFWFEGGGASAIPIEPFRIQAYEDGVSQAWYVDPGYGSTYAFEYFGVPPSKRDQLGNVSGEISTSLAGDVSSFTGLVVQNVSGTIDVTLANDTSNFTVVVGTPEGTFSSTLENIFTDISGQVTAAGPIDVTLAGVTMSSSGILLDAGTIAAVLGNDVMAFSGYWAEHATGTFGSTLVGVTNTDPPKPNTRIFIGALSISI